MQTGAGDLAALVCILVLGVPHGALDGEIARARLRPAFGNLWFVVFAAPYLCLSAAVLVAWRVAPEATLAAFLAASVWHFGEEDTAATDAFSSGARRLLAIATFGGAVVALPVLVHPAATARFFSLSSLTPMPMLPAWLMTASVLWCPAALYWLVFATRQRQWRAMAGAAVLAAIFVVLLPLPAFAAYFVCLHAPRHVACVIRQERAPRVRSTRDALCRAAPITALTFVIGAALWPLYPGPPADRLLSLTIQGLAALTLPHMLLDTLGQRNFASAWRYRRRVLSGVLTT